MKNCANALSRRINLDYKLTQSQYLEIQNLVESWPYDSPSEQQDKLKLILERSNPRKPDPKRIDNRVEDILLVYDRDPSNIKTILDIGSSDAKTLSSLANRLKLRKEDVYALDFLIKDKKNLAFTPLDNIKEIKDKSIDLIITHKMHHTSPKDKPALIKELARILSPTGSIMIREHDNNINTNNNTIKTTGIFIYLDIIHNYWYARGDKNPSHLYLSSFDQIKDLFKEIDLYPSIATYPIRYQRVYWANFTFSNNKKPTIYISTSESSNYIEEIGKNFIRTPSDIYRMMTDKNLYITNNSKTLRYSDTIKKSAFIAEWGQLKLFLTVFQTLGTYWDPIKVPNLTVVYAGAAPGYSIEVLSNMIPFSNIEWILYDPKNIMIQPREGKGKYNSGAIVIKEELFTDQEANEYKDRDNVFFFSDIRREDYLSSKNIELSIKEEMIMQQEWVRIMRPVIASLKMRLPFVTDDPSTFTMDYLDGEIMLQSFLSPGSSETRLIVRNPSDNKEYIIKTYDNKLYESQLSYHNVVDRAQSLYRDPDPDNFYGILDNTEGLDNHFDSVHFLYIISKYIDKFKTNDNILDLAVNLIARLNETIQSSITIAIREGRLKEEARVEYVHLPTLRRKQAVFNQRKLEEKLKEKSSKSIVKSISKDRSLSKEEALKLEFPYTSLFMTVAERDNAFNYIKNYQLKLVKKDYTIINMKKKVEGLVAITDPWSHREAVSAYFNDPVRVLCKRINEPSPKEYWDQNKEDIIDTVQKEKKVIAVKELNDYIWTQVKGCSMFRPTLVSGFIKYFKAKSMLDFCSGHGNELIGAMANDIRYVGVEPREEMFPIYQEMINTFATDPKKYTMINSKFQTAVLPEGETFDLILTGPPYFNLEIYSKDTTQSYTEGMSVALWKTEFLYPSLTKAWEVLKQGGYMCININDPPSYKENEEKVHYTEDMIRYMKSFPDAEYMGPISYASEKMESPQPIWIWYKQVTIDEESNQKLANFEDKLRDIISDLETPREGEDLNKEITLSTYKQLRFNLNEFKAFTPEQTNKLNKLIPNLIVKKSTVKGIINELYGVYSKRKEVSTSWGSSINFDDRLKAADEKLKNLSELIDQIISDFVEDGHVLYLDVGCGDGSMGTVFQYLYGLETKFIDIEDTIYPELKEIIPFELFNKDFKINLDRPVSICSLFHILHHIPSIEQIKFRLNNIYELLEPGGLLIIREHDIDSLATYVYICLYHIVYEVKEMAAGKSLEEFNNYMKNYKLTLMSAGVLVSILKESKFDLEAITVPTGVDRSYYILVRKPFDPNNISESIQSWSEISPEEEALMDLNPDLQIDLYKTTCPDIENIDIAVIRDDLLVAGTKGRGLELYFRTYDNDEFVFRTNSFGHDQVAVAYVCSLMKKKLTLFVQNDNIEGVNLLSSQTNQAITYGAIIKHIRNRMSEITTMATKYALDNNAALIDLNTPEYRYIMVRALSESIPEDFPYSRVWMTVDSGNILYSAATVLNETEFIALPVNPVSPIYLEQYGELQNRIITEYNPSETYELKSKVEKNNMPPYPSAENYDAKIWQYANCDAQPSDIIWNMSN